jgi:CubicO group peptidase (beta-lactamase class C family)
MAEEVRIYKYHSVFELARLIYQYEHLTVLWTLKRHRTFPKKRGHCSHETLTKLLATALALRYDDPTFFLQEFLKMEIISPEQAGFSSQRLKRLDSVMQRYIDEGKIAGVVNILARRGQVFHMGCYGMADVERSRPMQTDTIFRMWSVTKAITAVAVLLLYEEGHFVLETDISTLLPAYRETKVFAGMDGDQPKYVSKERPITVRQLLLHTTGMATNSAFVDTPPIKEMDEFFKSMSPQSPMTLAAVVDGMARIPLAWQPNSNWAYGPSFELAARLVEVVSGKPYADFLRERIFESLGMMDSGYVVNQAQLERFSAFYSPGENGKGLRVIDDPEKSIHYVPDGKLPENVWTPGGHGSVSTPNDLLRFAQMLANRGQLDGVRLLAPRTVDLMTTNHLPPHLLPYVFYGRTDYGYGQGLGVHVLMDNGQAGIPCSNGEYWKDGGSGTLFWVDPQYDLVGVVLYQLDPFALYPIWHQTKALVYQAMQDV